MSIVARGCTLFIAVSDASATPPYRVENRSRTTSIEVRANLRPRDGGAADSTPRPGALLAHLPPASWASVAPVASKADERGSPLVLSSNDVFRVCVGAVPPKKGGRAWEQSEGFGAGGEGHGCEGGDGDGSGGRVLSAQPSKGVAWRAYSLHDVRHLPALTVPYALSRAASSRHHKARQQRRQHFHQLLLQAPLSQLPSWECDGPSSELQVMVRLQQRTRVLVLSDHELDFNAEAMDLAPKLIRLDAQLDAVGLVFIDEGGASGRPQELMHMAMRKVRLELALPTSRFDPASSASEDQPGRRDTELTFSIGLVQIDNLLPSTTYPVVLQTPRCHHDGTSTRVFGGGIGGDGRGKTTRGRGTADASGGGAVAAVRLLVRRRASGQLQDVVIELKPIDLAMEASFLVRLGHLLAGGGESSTRIVASLNRAARRGVSSRALEERLGAFLAAPPDWSQRVPFYCDTLRISGVELTVSSRLDVDMGSELLLMSTSSNAAGSSSSSSERNEHAQGDSEWFGITSLPIVSNLLELLMVLIKGIGANLANISGVPFQFDELRFEHPLCTKSELAYNLLQRMSWQAAAQLGKLLGHSEMLGNPVGMLFEIGTGVTGGLQGVGRGIARGDGDQIVMGGRQLMGSVVGGAAGLGARLTGSLHSIVQRLTESIHRALLGLESEGYDKIEMLPGEDVAGAARASLRRGESVAGASTGGSALVDMRRGLHLSLKEALKAEGKAALKNLAHAIANLLLRPLQGAHQHGTLGVVRGMADGVINFVLLPIGATLETGAVVLHTVEQAARGATLDGPPPLMRPARSFHSDLRLLPLRQCIMTVLEIGVLELRCSSVQRGSVHIQTSIYEPSYGSRRAKHKTEPRGWLDGFRWDHVETHLVRSLDARLLVRVFSTGSHLRLRRRRCIGSVALRLATIRALCRPVHGASDRDERGSRHPGSAVGASPPFISSAAGRCNLHVYHECAPRWFTLRLRAKRREALRAEEELTRHIAQCAHGANGRHATRHARAGGCEHCAARGS